MHLEFETTRLPLSTPLRAAWGELRERELVHVTLEDGHGEAAPLEPYDGVSTAAVLSALDAYAAALRDLPPETPLDDVLDRCRAERPLPQALAAIDLALWDRASRQTGLRVADMLAARLVPYPSMNAVIVPPTVPVNATVGAEDRAGAAEAAARAATAGFRCVKVKVGVGDDAGRLAAVRAAVGPHTALRTDANGAWATPDEALTNLRALAPLDLELCEEPVHGIDALRAVRAGSPVQVAMDETAAEPGAVGSGAADAVCLKIARCGGLTALLRDASAARGAGAAVYVASTYDGPLGIAAGVHAAGALLATGTVAPCGLATLQAFADEAARPPALLPVEGAIATPRGPGLTP